MSPEAIAGSIAEEMDDDRRRSTTAQAFTWMGKAGTWYGWAACREHPSGLTHAETKDEFYIYEQRLREHPEWETNPRGDGVLGELEYLKRKALYPTTLDLGRPRFNLHTAVRLLREYNARYPDTDPLHLKKYNHHYDQLSSDLASRDSRATVAFAGLMAEKATRWFKAAAPEWWDRQRSDQQAALIVDYYNLGEVAIEKRYRERMERGETYEPMPGESGKRHQANHPQISHALNL